MAEKGEDESVYYTLFHLLNMILILDIQLRAFPHATYPCSCRHDQPSVRPDETIASNWGLSFYNPLFSI